MLRDIAREKLNNYARQVAEHHGVLDLDKGFSVTPANAQHMVDVIQASADFLQKINMPLVDQMKGDAIGLGINAPITGRTNVLLGDRTPADPSTLEAVTYDCLETEVEVFLAYKKLDQWAHLPNFEEKFESQLVRRIALDQIMIGFNGTSRATSTNRTTNPLLQDVNKGWLQRLREYNTASQVLTEASVGAGIKLGDTGSADVRNLDSLVHACLQKIKMEHRVGLVVIIGEELLAYDKTKLYAAQGATPTEKERIEMAQVIATYGGIPAYTVPGFPARGIFITAFENLSIYTQESSIRRSLVDWPKRNRVEQYMSRNEDYLIETPLAAAMVEPAKVKLWNGLDGEDADFV